MLGISKVLIYSQHKIERLHMQSDIDTMTYMMAAEKMGNLLFCMEQTIDFMEEYKIKPDDEVKKCLTPMIDQFKKWLE